jgi:hypothetical protein
MRCSASQCLTVSVANSYCAAHITLPLRAPLHIANTGVETLD